MSFAIEVPGEATPFSLFELGKALEAAAISTDNAQRQSAGQQLQAWESQPEYYTTLQTIFLDKSLRNEIRFLAIILFKNGVERHWRARAKHAIPPPQKELIRSRLLQGSVDEPEKSLSLHNALAIAKIIRIDYPTDWPDALPLIIGVTRASKDNPVHLAGSLMVLLRIVKELGTARLRSSQTTLQAVTPELVQLLGEIYTERTTYWQQFFTKGQGDEDDADYAMQNSLTALKILRRLVTVGYDQPHTDAMVQGFWSLSQTQFDQFLSGVGNESWIPVPFQDLVGKHLMQFTKLHIDMAEMHPASYPVLPNSIPLTRAYWGLVKEFSEVFEKSGGIKETTRDTPGGNPKHEGPLSEKLALKGLILLRSCVAIVHRPVQTFKYRSPEAKAQEKAAVEIIKTQLLTNDLLLDIVQVVISRLFIFRKSDLEAWEEDPETWESQERNEGPAFEWAVRPCAERLLLDLLCHYHELKKPLITYCELATKVEMDIVTKEAAYCALGCATSNVYDVFDFDHLLNTTLVKEAQLQDPMAKLLRRRIAILLSIWTPIWITSPNWHVVYEVFRHLLNPKDPHNDEVVRITAARQFKLVADQFEFPPEAFIPYAADFFNLLIGLIEEVENEETKLAILGTVRAIVSSMDKGVSPFGDAIMSTLPKLWSAEGSEEYMMKQSILAITTSLVTSMGSEFVRFLSMVIPLLREALNPESALHLHLIEESVELWSAVVTQCSLPPPPELTQMVELALPLLEYDSLVANQCLEVTKNYILLAPAEMLGDALRRPALGAIAKTLDVSSREQNKLGIESLGLFVRMAEEIGGVPGVSVVVQDMLEIGLIRTILERLHGAWEASQTTGPNRKKDRISSIKQADYFFLLARIATADPAVFANMLSTVGGGFEAVWSWLGPQWFATFDYIVEVDHQKLSCLGLTRLCELPSPVQDLVLARLQDYLSMWTTIITELREDSGDTDPPKELLIWDKAEAEAVGEWDTALDIHTRKVAARDPVHTVVVYDFARARLEDLIRRVGGEQAFEANWAVNVDKEVLAGFQGLSQPRAQGQMGE